MYHIDIQFAADKALSPKPALLKKWAKAALASKTKNGEITIRIVGSAEMTELNEAFRQKKYATNVLSFPFEMPPDVTLDLPIHGDIVICPEVVNREAIEENKSQDAHWAHMIVHGVLHLLGHDHETEADAKVMEDLEIEIMQQLGYENPYESEPQ